MQGLPSDVQLVPDPFSTSAGHAALEPVQLSARSHSPAAARQVVEDDANTSVGQALFAPSQVSATSQTPAEVRQVLPAATFASAGHVALDPEQVSWVSHTPPDARQTVPDVLNTQALVQQEPVVPLAAPWSHCSLTEASTVPLPHREVTETVTK